MKGIQMEYLIILFLIVLLLTKSFSKKD